MANSHLQPSKFTDSGHLPTLFAAFLYFTFSCCIWEIGKSVV